MSRRLSEDEIRGILCALCESAYATLSFHRHGPNLTLGDSQDTFSQSFDEFWASVPNEPAANTPAPTSSAQCPEPGAFTMVPLSAPFALRCSPNTISAGQRCRYQSFYPEKLFGLHADYFARRGHLPQGGARRPYVPHPDDYWTAFKPRQRPRPIGNARAPSGKAPNVLSYVEGVNFERPKHCLSV